MKHLFLYAFISLFSASAFSQQKDTLHKVSIDSAALFSYHDVERFLMQSVKDMPTQYGLKVLNDWANDFQQLVAAYNQQKQIQTKEKLKK